MRFAWRYIKSFFSLSLLERGQSTITPGLMVHLDKGRPMLNTFNVNYSYGRLDTIFREAFLRLKIDSRPWDSALILGLGAGNMAQILAELAPGLMLTGVELDPEVLRLGATHFGLAESPRLRIVRADAMEFIQQSMQPFDLVLVDLFVDDQVPPAACTPAFLSRCRDLIAPGGMLVFNRLGHTPSLRQQTEAFGRTFVATLEGAYSIKADLNQVWVYEKK